MQIKPIKYTAKVYFQTKKETIKPINKFHIEDIDFIEKFFQRRDNFI